MSTPAEQAAGASPPAQPVHGHAAGLPAHGPPAEPDRTEPPTLRRRRSGRVVAGVSGGIADHLGVPVLGVRVVFAVLAGLGGAGLLAYALLWAFVPAAETGIERPSTAREQQQAVGLVALGVGLALAGAAWGTTWGGWVTGPLGIALIGAAVVWREADAGQRVRWRSGAGAVFGGGGRMALLRVLAGIALVASGITVFLLNQGNLGQLRFALLAAVATL
ncbi:MAG: PspC domain-containing protein, partial [Pseudonocardiaceae bacterium]